MEPVRRGAGDVAAHAPPDAAAAVTWSSSADPVDADVVGEVLAGDVESYAVLVRRYRDSYARFAVGMLGDANAVEDALHAAFVRAFRTLDRCPSPSPFGAWLYRLVAAECLARAPRPPVVRERAATPLDLPPEEREALLLHRAEELTLDEIAELTGHGPDLLRERLARAERRLGPNAIAKAPAAPSASFGARVMDSVRVEARVRRRVAERRSTPREAMAAVAEAAPRERWWSRRTTVTLTPGRVALLAVAGLVVIAAAVVGGVLAVG